MTNAQTSASSQRSSGHCSNGEITMVTDPVKRVRPLESETPLELNLDQVIKRLAALPPSPKTPYVTAYLDWRPDGSAPGRLDREEPLRSQRNAAAEPSHAARRPSRQQFD